LVKFPAAPVVKSGETELAEFVGAAVVEAEAAVETALVVEAPGADCPVPEAVAGWFVVVRFIADPSVVVAGTLMVVADVMVVGWSVVLDAAITSAPANEINGNQSINQSINQTCEHEQPYSFSHCHRHVMKFEIYYEYEE